MNDELHEQVYYEHIHSRIDVLEKFQSENDINRSFSLFDAA
jgi:hypothetical protein